MLMTPEKYFLEYEYDCKWSSYGEVVMMYRRVKNTNDDFIHFKSVADMEEAQDYIDTYDFRRRVLEGILDD